MGMIRFEVRFAGVGGQGIILMGRIYGYAAFLDGWNVVQTQSYGAEARGTAARSEVILSRNKIGYPRVRKCDILVALSKPALEAYRRDLKEDGILIIDSSVASGLDDLHGVHVVPATSEAEKLGSPIYSNMIMLGSLTKISDLVRANSIKRAIEKYSPPKMLKWNLKAFDKGREL